jgi:hypothetical protein
MSDLKSSSGTSPSINGDIILKANSSYVRSDQEEISSFEKLGIFYGTYKPPSLAKPASIASSKDKIEAFPRVLTYFTIVTYSTYNRFFCN